MKNGIIWMLHRVAPDNATNNIFKIDNSLRISPEFLECQIIKAKQQGYQFVSLDTFLTNKHKKNPGSKTITITIDDGFRDIYLYAFPIFKRHQIPFTFYIASDLIKYGFDKCNQPEMDGIPLLMNILSSKQKIKVKNKEYDISTAQRKQKVFGIIWKEYKNIKKAANRSGRKIIADFLPEEEIDFNQNFKQYVCHLSELKEMAKSELCTIGSHGKTHTPLTGITEEKQLEEEFSKSRTEIEKWIGKKVLHFSYPYGQYNEKSKSYAQKYYQSAVSIKIPKETRRYCKIEDNDYSLPRVSVEKRCSFSSLVDKCSITKILKNIIMKVYKREHCPEGRRQIYIFGYKVYSYQKYKI